MTTDPGSVQAVCFDFDGTLIDSYAAITASVNFIRARYDLAPLLEAEVRRQVGRGAAYLLEHTVPGTDVATDLALYRDHHPTVMRELTRLLPGAVEAIKAIKASRRAVALCSNKPRQFSLELLAYLQLREQFDLVLGPEDVAHPKPAPDKLIEGLRRLDVAAAHALYIGDMSVDIETARGAGVRVWVVPTGSESREVLQAAQPDRLLHDLFELPRLLVSE
jgi:phosphoglycolate phosphatase